MLLAGSMDEAGAALIPIQMCVYSVVPVHNTKQDLQRDLSFLNKLTPLLENRQRERMELLHGFME